MIYLIFNRDSNRLAEIPVMYIFPNKSQPRRFFEEEELSSLSNSIYRNGIIQPLTVRRISSVEYELVAGERRLRAAIMAGFNKVPCIIMKCSDNQSAVFALIENVQRDKIESENVRLLEITDPICSREIVITVNKNKVDNENVEAFFEYLKKRCITQKTAMTIGTFADCN